MERLVYGEVGVWRGWCVERLVCGEVGVWSANVCGVLMCVGGDEYGKVDVCRIWVEGMEGWRGVGGGVCVCGGKG